jgi:hypothetical protein
MIFRKVGEAQMYPFGDDDDDIDTVALIENNLELSYLMVDEMHNHRPATLSDDYWTFENLMKPPNCPPPDIPSCGEVIHFKIYFFVFQG